MLPHGAACRCPCKWWASLSTHHITGIPNLALPCHRIAHARYLDRAVFHTDAFCAFQYRQAQTGEAYLLLAGRLVASKDLEQGPCRSRQPIHEGAALLALR